LQGSFLGKYNIPKARSKRPSTREETPVSISAYEQRLQVLEAAVADLRSQQPARDAGRTSEPTDNVMPNVEQPLIPAVPPKHRSRFRARLSRVQPGSRSLGLSDAEWVALNIGEADE